MTIALDIPGRTPLQLEHVVLDMNGTLTGSGALIKRSAERIRALSQRVELHLLSADTFGTAAVVAEELGVPLRGIAHGDDKRSYVEQLGAAQCAAIGNGSNDAAMFKAAALGIAVVGPEGASMTALVAADVVCGSSRPRSTYFAIRSRSSRRCDHDRARGQ
jgi:P-type E1-E2 ATPase